MKGAFKTAATLVVAAVVALSLVNCGGSSHSSAPPPPQQTGPPPLTITTTALPPGFYGEFYSVTLQASGGTGALTWNIRGGALPQGLNLDHALGVISGIIADTSLSSAFTVSAQDAANRTATHVFNLSWSNRPPKILNSSLPNGFVGSRYTVTLATTVPSANLQLVSGTLPLGVNLQGQTLDGTPTTANTYNFVLGIPDSTGTVVDQRAFTIDISGVTGSGNNSISNAVLLSNGTYSGSISPFVDPTTSTSPSPDQDYYKLIAQPGSIVSIQIMSETLSVPLSTPLDSVIELVDSSGVQLGTCDSPGQSGLSSSCLNDDNLEAGTHDSKLLFKAPGGAPTTFYLHVLDWRGDSRPDMFYKLQIFGAN